MDKIAAEVIILKYNVGLSKL